MHCKFRLQCASAAANKIWEQQHKRERICVRFLRSYSLLFFSHSAISFSLFCLFRWLFAYFNCYQMRKYSNTIYFIHTFQLFFRKKKKKKIKHQFHFQVIYTFCSIKRIANLSLCEKRMLFRISLNPLQFIQL